MVFFCLSHMTIDRCGWISIWIDHCMYVFHNTILCASEQHEFICLTLFDIVYTVRVICMCLNNLRFFFYGLFFCIFFFRFVFQLINETHEGRRRWWWWENQATKHAFSLQSDISFYLIVAIVFFFSTCYGIKYEKPKYMDDRFDGVYAIGWCIWVYRPCLDAT